MFDDYTFHFYPGRADSERVFKDRARVADASREISASLKSSGGRRVATVTGANSIETLYFHGVRKPAEVLLNGKPLPEQPFSADSAGWSFGKTDFPLQDGEVLKVRVKTTGPVECVFRE